MEARSADTANARLLDAEDVILSALMRLRGLEWSPEGTAAYIAADLANEGFLDPPPNLPHGAARCRLPRVRWWRRYTFHYCSCGKLYSMRYIPMNGRGIWMWVVVGSATLHDAKGTER